MVSSRATVKSNNFILARNLPAADRDGWLLSFTLHRKHGAAISPCFCKIIFKILTNSSLECMKISGKNYYFLL